MGIEKLTVSLQSGVLADTYTIEQLFDEPLGTAHAGYVYGFPLNCTVRSKSSNLAGRYTLRGDYDISEKLKRYLNTSHTNAAAIMTDIATQLGKTAVINIDNHNTAKQPINTSVMQVLSDLFGWTASLPHQFVNVYLRGDVLHVIQRGKETSSYTLQKFCPARLGEETVDTLMDAAAGSPFVYGEAPEVEDEDEETRYFSGIFSFGGALVQFVNGLNVLTIIGNGVGTSGSTRVINSYNDKLLMETTTQSWGDDEDQCSNSQTTFSYGTYDGVCYTSTATTTTRKGSASIGSGDIESVSVTYYVPRGFGKFGQHVENSQYFYTQSGAFSHIETTSQDSVGEAPAGEASQWTQDTAQKSATVSAPSASIARNPISGNHIPAADAATVQRYATGLEWLDGKARYELEGECLDEHIVDFDQTVTVIGKTWYLESNQFVIGPGAAVRQSLKLVRWE